jgi:hypothetical protein
MLSCIWFPTRSYPAVPVEHVLSVSVRVVLVSAAMVVLVHVAEDSVAVTVLGSGLPFMHAESPSPHWFVAAFVYAVHVPASSTQGPADP